MKSLIQALRLFTLLPIPGKQLSVSRSLESGGGTAAYPLAGLVIGALSAATAWGSGMFLGPWGIAVMATVARIVITGGMHLDGLADLADGWGGGPDRDRRLAIMADSRLGSFGALALMVVLCLQTVFIFEWVNKSILSQNSKVMTFLPVILIPALSRGILPLLMKRFPSARPGGMGKQARSSVTIIGAGMALLFGALPVSACFFPSGLILSVSVFIVMSVVGLGISKSLGGLTGDCYGALIEIGDTAGFLGVLIFL